MKRILVVDDEPHVLEAIELALQKWFDVTSATNADEALEAVEKFEPDLVVLDIMLPDMAGTELCRELRRTRDVPIIFVTGLDGDTDRIIGLELGADDYVTKPFHAGELLARVKAVLRRFDRAARAAAPPPPQDVLTHGPIRVDLDQFKVFVHEEEVELTKTELLLLKTLMQRTTKAYSRDELREGAYGHGTFVDDRTINSHIRRLREAFEKFGIDPIETVRGIGYRISLRRLEDGQLEEDEPEPQQPIH